VITVSNKNLDSFRRVITFSDSFAIRATQSSMGQLSRSSPRMLTSFQQLPMHSINLFHCSAMDFHSLHSSLAQLQQSGATQRRGNTTGVQCLFGWVRASGRGTSDLSNNTSPLVATTIVHTCNLAMGHRYRSTSQPTKLGERTVMTLRQHLRWLKTCWFGDHDTPIANFQEC